MRIRHWVKVQSAQNEYGFGVGEGLVRLGIVTGILAVAAFILSLGLPSEYQQQIENPNEGMVHHAQTLETRRG